MSAGRSPRRRPRAARRAARSSVGGRGGASRPGRRSARGCARRRVRRRPARGEPRVRAGGLPGAGLGDPSRLRAGASRRRDAADDEQQPERDGGLRAPWWRRARGLGVACPSRSRPRRPCVIGARRRLAGCPPPDPKWGYPPPLGRGRAGRQGLKGGVMQRRNRLAAVASTVAFLAGGAAPARAQDSEVVTLLQDLVRINTVQPARQRGAGRRAAAHAGWSRSGSRSRSCRRPRPARRT